MTSSLEKYLTAVMQNQIELDALNLIENSITTLNKIESQSYPTRKAKLEALVEPGKNLVSATNIIKEADAKRVAVGLAPSYNFLHDEALGLSFPDKEKTPAMLITSSQDIISTPQVETVGGFANDESEFVLRPYKRKTATRVLKEEEEEEDEDEEDEEDDEEDSMSEYSDEISEDADEEGIVSDDQPLKIHRTADEDESEKEVMNFDPCRLDKRSRRPSAKAREAGEFFKIRGDGTYSLRDVKPKPTTPLAMIEAALFDKNMHPIERWIESKVFQNKAFMVFGAYETKKSNQAYQRLLRLAKSGRLELDEKPSRASGVCMLCNSTKPISCWVRDDSDILGEIGADCRERFDLALRHCQFLIGLKIEQAKVHAGSVDEFLEHFRILGKSVTHFLKKQEKKQPKK